MKISIASDLHLEFAGLDIENTDSADVLVLAGDIIVVADADAQGLSSAHSRQAYISFLAQASAKFNNVVYVLGNHEFYGGTWQNTAEDLRLLCRQWPNIHVLDNGQVQIGETRFLGSTLWTDFARQDPLVLWEIRGRMADYHQIRHDHNQRCILPEDVLARHLESRSWLEQQLQQDAGSTVIVSHHAPSPQSLHPRYRFSPITNAAYHSDLESIIDQHPEIRLWVHGHTHNDFDYTVSNTRVICNPRGYVGHEAKADSWKLLTVEI